MSTQKSPSTFQQRTVLITAGPTREPIDDVRFLGNRSSGALGIELARAAAEAGLSPTLALGQSVPNPNLPGVRLIRFDETAELREVLRRETPSVDILVMAAAVSDHTPRTRHKGKLARASRGRFSIDLVPTPDLLAEAADDAEPGQLLVGFALEPEDGLRASAQRKLEAKGVDIVVANPLNTMDSGSIDATIVCRSEYEPLLGAPGGPMPKQSFAAWLVPRLIACHEWKANT